MGVGRQDEPSADQLRTIANGFVGMAREQNTRRLQGELLVDDVRVEVLVERDLVEVVDEGPDGSGPVRQETTAEHVTVWTGPKSRRKVAVAAPVDWIAA